MNRNRPKVTKAQIVDHIFEQSENERKDIQHIIELFFEEVKNALAKNSVVELRGFGTFEVRSRKGLYKARNPRTGDQVLVEPHGVTIFRPGKELRSRSRNVTGTGMVSSGNGGNIDSEKAMWDNGNNYEQEQDSHY